jgi:hypothetical protein
MQKGIQPPACSVHGLHRSLLAGALKKSSKVQLYFCSGCGMMNFFTCEPKSKKQMMYLPHLWNTA